MTTTNNVEAQVTPNATANSTNQVPTVVPVVPPVADATIVAAPVVPPVEQKVEEKPAAEVKPDQQKPAPPEKYELKLPEGSLLDSSVLEDVSSFAKEKGYSQEQALELLQREDLAVRGYHSAQQEALKAKSVEWKNQVSTDKELGGEHFAKNVEFAHRALGAFGSDGLKAALQDSGFGNHPEVVRMLYRVGKAMAEDKIIGNGSSPQEKKSMEETFYGKQN